MSDDLTVSTIDREIDVREISRVRRHPFVFAAYEQLVVGQSLVLTNDHEPRHLREEFDAELAGSFAWEPVPSDGQQYRVRITKIARTPLPRVVADTAALAGAAAPEAAGSIWHLEPAGRDLDSNIIALPPGGEIGRHDGPALDVLLLVLLGTGTLETEKDTVALRPGELIWLPRTAQRRIVAGPEGIRYLTVHHRKPTLNITAAPTVATRQSRP